MKSIAWLHYEKLFEGISKIHPNELHEHIIKSIVDYPFPRCHYCEICHTIIAISGEDNETSS